MCERHDIPDTPVSKTFSENVLLVELSVRRLAKAQDEAQ
jgi:hypothetical protein